jgi:hypothetical protein
MGVVFEGEYLMNYILYMHRPSKNGKVTEIILDIFANQIPELSS